MPIKKQIVFFCSTAPYVMIYKIAKEFKRKGYEVILITFSEKEKWDLNVHRTAYDKIICSNFQLQKPIPKNIFKMFKRLPFLVKSIFEMKRLNPYAVFAIACPNYITAFGMKFFKKYPLIYFPYDVLSRDHPNAKEAIKKGIKKYEFESEKYCFEHADGIMHKGGPGELDHLNKKKEFKKTPLKLSFQPFCSDEFMVRINENKLSKKDGSIHLAFIGGLFTTPDYLEFYMALFKVIIRNKIHIHVYQKSQHLSKLEDAKNVSEGFKQLLNTKYFHLHEALNPKEIVSEISKYDYGLWIDDIYKQGKESHKYYTGNKISSYFEAGIPFFYSEEMVFLDKLMKKYNLSLGVNINNVKDLEKLKEKIAKLNYKNLEKNIEKARKDFNIKKQFSFLENFLKKVVDKKTQ